MGSRAALLRPTAWLALWWRISASLWFVPAVMVLAALALAIALIELEDAHGLDLAERWPQLFGAGVDGSRELLAAVASSMITVAGVVFSVTIVALSLGASAYSPRVLRTFMGDRPTQMVLAALVLAIALIELEDAHGLDLAERWPQLFGAGVDGSRELLAAVASSMITVAGVVF
ncbi:MAG TPA: DUF2254 family protein, partial [Burkholderiales bacterium]|nr:DUF2254 family protein [Burkholderiales bacterium]